MQSKNNGGHMGDHLYGGGVGVNPQSQDEWKSADPAHRIQSKAGGQYHKSDHLSGQGQVSYNGYGDELKGIPGEVSAGPGKRMQAKGRSEHLQDHMSGSGLQGGGQSGMQNRDGSSAGPQHRIQSKAGGQNHIQDHMAAGGIVGSEHSSNSAGQHSRIQSKAGAQRKHQMDHSDVLNQQNSTPQYRDPNGIYHSEGQFDQTYMGQTWQKKKQSQNSAGSNSYNEQVGDAIQYDPRRPGDGPAIQRKAGGNNHIGDHMAMGGAVVVSDHSSVSAGQQSRIQTKGGPHANSTAYTADHTQGLHHDSHGAGQDGYAVDRNHHSDHRQLMQHKGTNQSGSYTQDHTGGLQHSSNAPIGNPTGQHKKHIDGDFSQDHTQLSHGKATGEGWERSENHHNPHQQLMQHKKMGGHVPNADNAGPGMQFDSHAPTSNPGFAAKRRSAAGGGDSVGNIISYGA